MDIDEVEQLTAEELPYLDNGVEKLNVNQATSNNQEESKINDHGTQSDLAADFFGNTIEPQLDHLECLKSKFKHESFRAKQWEIIRTITQEKRDVCAIMSAGYGKSLCFQFPAVYSNGTTLVVSPLIALMKAQVLSLKDSGISACFVGTAQEDPHILRRISECNYNIIYSSPKYLQSERGNQLLNILNGRLTLVAIDQAHVRIQTIHQHL